MVPDKKKAGSFQVYMNLSRRDIEHILNTQVGIADYVQPGIEGKPSPDHSYPDNQALWVDILDDKLGPTTVLTLQDTYLLEWFPRSPGLYHTPHGAESRREARHHVIKAPGEAPSAVLNETDLSVRGLFDHANDAEYVFDPYGKSSMLRGGVGCFRLRGRTLRKIGTIYFLSASSSGVAHEGFLVGLGSVPIPVEK